MAIVRSGLRSSRSREREQGVQEGAMGFARLPLALRLAIYGFAVVVLLFLTLAPSNDLPTVNVWDKAEHAIAWLVLAGLGLLLFPRHAVRIALFSLGVGVLVEILQATPMIARDADIRDVLADSAGIAAALVVGRLVRRPPP
jgi:VanZ family protein